MLISIILQVFWFYIKLESRKENTFLHTEYFLLSNFAYKLHLHRKWNSRFVVNNQIFPTSYQSSVFITVHVHCYFCIPRYTFCYECIHLITRCSMTDCDANHELFLSLLLEVVFVVTSHLASSAWIMNACIVCVLSAVIRSGKWNNILKFHCKWPSSYTCFCLFRVCNLS